MKKKDQRFTVEDLWKIDRPAQPALSPDGAQACVSVTSFDMEENKSRTSLWLLSAYGGAPRRLTAAGEKDGEPRWSPDGRWIAFVAKRGVPGSKDTDEEHGQVYLIAPDGGEARRLTDIATGAFGIKWFPDSRRIAFLSWVWPDTSDLDRLAKRYKAFKDDKVKAHVVEHAAYRFWDHWLSDGRVLHVFTVDVESGKVRDVFAGSRYELVKADPSAHSYDISPDGGAIAFAFDPAEDKRFDHENEIVELDLAKRRFRSLTDARLNHESPRYSPDGRWLALLTQDLRKSPVAPHRLAFLDRRAGKLQHAHASWDRSVHAPLAWSGDSRAVVFAAEDDARQHLFRWERGARAPEAIARGGTVMDFDVAGDAVAFVRNDMSTPPQVFWAAHGEDERRIDAFNDALMGRLRLGKVREFRIGGFGGEEVQMWAVYPPDFDPKKKWPLLHNIHGGPHSIWGDNFHFRWNNHVFAAQGYVVLCVNYHGSSSFGQAFKASIDHEFGKRELFDVEAGTDFMLAQGYIDRERLVAAGGSYGGYMVAWMNGHTDRYKAYVCHAGCFDWVAMFSDDAYYWHPKELGAFYWDDMKRVEAQNPRAHVKGMKTPTLVIHGMLDYRVPDSQGLAYYNTLKAKGVPARLVFFPDENHWILKPQNSRLWYREFFAWLARFVEPGGRKGGPRQRR